MRVENKIELDHQPVEVIIRGKKRKRKTKKKEKVLEGSTG